MKIKYKIEMLSDWHIGSGLDGGADADNLVLKDEHNLPYIPGKTVKGLLKDSLMEMADIHNSGINISDIEKFFGKEIKNTDKKKTIGSVPGNLFFSNAELNSKERVDISMNNLSNYLFKNIASTKIDNRGIAKKGSLRTMEVCIPVTLEGEIEGDNIDTLLFEKAFKWTRHLGVNRNRGLGRCKITMIKD